jgi:D-3-phosphoglycerate dehydrogenase / 2-oxoglutarate reductase
VNRRILVTPRSLTSSPHPLVERMRGLGFDIVYCTPGKLPAEDELVDLVPGCVGWLAGVEPVSERVIEAADRLAIIARNGTGVDNLPLDLLRRRGIELAIARGANARGVAELALAMILSGLRHVPRTDAGIKLGGWPRHTGREIAGATIGIVGCGAVGATLARLCAGLGARVLGHDPMEPEIATGSETLAYLPLPQLFEQCDVVSLHCPSPADGRPVVTAERLGSMPQGSILVNTARAGLVDEDALLVALESGRLSAYATDVFATEPPTDLRLASHPAVIATSHVGGLTTESVERATRMATDAIIAALRTHA